MHEFIKLFAEWTATTIEGIGIVVLLLGAVYTLIYAGIRWARYDDATESYHRVRRVLGRAILLGLEFLVAADIIMTVAVELTFERVGVLGLVVLIRTFLSFALEVEMTGQWPWQKEKS